MTFSIAFLPDDVIDLVVEPGERRGSIAIGAFHETFFSDIRYWSPIRYREHWIAALTRVVVDGDDSCLITSFGPPAETRMLHWWPLYRDKGNVVVQSGLLFFDQLERPFDEHRPFDAVRRRVSINEDGQRLSEWYVSVNEIEAFLAKTAG